VHNRGPVEQLDARTFVLRQNFPNEGLHLANDAGAIRRRGAMNTASVSLPPANRAAQRRSIRRFREGSNAIAAVLTVLDFFVFVAALAAVVYVPSELAKALASLVVGLQISRLFVLGHDACHQSLFTHRDANRWIGRLLLLPSLTPFSTWEVGHNLGHHAYTNLRGKDYVWTPLSKDEFDALPTWRRALERFYRSGFGFGAYYLIELWWHKLFFVSRKHIATQRPAFIGDSVLVLGYTTVWVAGLLAAAHLTQQSAYGLLFFGFVAPLLLWGSLMGAVIYLHHTHPRLVWYRDIDAWEAARDTSCNTVHVQIPYKLGRLINNIMEHPAHHYDARIPAYNLEAANEALHVPEQIVEPLSLRSIATCVSRCKLYDYERRCWTDFDGQPSPS
jgi:omega-6 fatty acid desaturase (delta-12 desaturase)